MSTDNHLHESGHVASQDGTKVAYHMTIPANVRAKVIIVHGFAEHSGRYSSIAKQLADRSIASLRFDYRGHGASGGKRGHVFRFEDYLYDFDAALLTLNKRLTESIPIFVMAHSYGGLISLHAIQRHRFSGLILSSPFYGFAIKVPMWKALAGRLLSKYIPALALPTDIDPKIVSHDPATIDEYGTDPLIGRVASARWLTETEKAQQNLEGLAAHVTLPILYQQAGDDRLVDAEAGRRVFDAFASQDKTWQAYPEQFHEIWFELERERTLASVYQWLETQLGASSEEK